MLHGCRKARKKKTGPATEEMEPMKGSDGDCGGKRKRAKREVFAYNGPFRDNIRLFLEDYAERQGNDVCSVGGFATWRLPIVTGGKDFLFALYIVEENVEQSSRPLCESCTCVGWSHHFVSKRRYHLIIPGEYEWTKPMGEEVFELNTHLLHGMIHCNGFGHLLCINGEAEDPSPSSANDLMGLWDRICNILRVRKITVSDMTSKGTMDLRLLCGVAYGQSWFGKWGYKFCRGSFGVTVDKYRRAIEILRRMVLDEVVKDLPDGSPREAIQSIVDRYRKASRSQLVTMRDLLRFMLDSRSINPQPSEQPTDLLKSTGNDDDKSSVKVGDGLVEVSGSLMSLPSTVTHAHRWPVRRLQHAAKVIAKALKKHESESTGGWTGMGRQDLRDAVRMFIGDTGLIDFVLRHIHNTTVGHQVIRRQMNPGTKTYEFTLQGVSTTLREDKLEVKGSLQDFDVYGDILCLHDNVLYGYPQDHPVSLSVQDVIDSKHFMKKWSFSASISEDDDKSVNILCRVVPSYHELVNKFTRPLPPGELIRVSKYANNTDIKSAAEGALRDTYFVTDRFIVTDVHVREGGRKALEVYSVSGTALDSNTELRYEGGLDNWEVDCMCGARDNDGERMEACYGCKVHQHTLCNGIEDDVDPAPTFRCWKCKRGKSAVGTDKERA